MASSVNRRLAESYLSELLEDENLPVLEAQDVGTIPTGDIVERLILTAVSVGRKRTKKHGEVIVLTYAIPEDVDGD